MHLKPYAHASPRRSPSGSSRQRSAQRKASSTSALQCTRAAHTCARPGGAGGCSASTSRRHMPSSGRPISTPGECTWARPWPSGWITTDASECCLCLPSLFSDHDNFVRYNICTLLLGHLCYPLYHYMLCMLLFVTDPLVLPVMCAGCTTVSSWTGP